MKKQKLVNILISFFLVAGCAKTDTSSTASASAQALQTYSNVSLDSGFDTFFSLQETAADKTIFDTHFTEASASFTSYSQLFDIYNTYDGINNLKTINDNAGIAPVKVDAEIIQMLELAKEFYTISNGEFDVTMGALLKVWHTYREAGIALNEDDKYGTLPTLSELQEAAKHHGWDKVEINEADSTVYITDPTVSLDVGGVAKGFAAEKIAQKLETEDVIAGAVNAGGNNRTIHQKADGSDWRVGIQNPGGEGSLIVVSRPGTMSFVTSGDYERYYTAEDGKNYSHIIDPVTMYPAVYYHSVTVITPDSGVADCLSTTLFTMTFAEGNQLIQAYRQAHPDTELDVIWIMDPDQKPDTQYGKAVGDYYVAYTEGLEGAITWQ